jgi:hypothetical protein
VGQAAKLEADTMAKLGMLALFLSVTATYVACLLVVVAAASSRWKIEQRIGASTMLTLMFVGFVVHFYMQNYMTRA